jgi:hypothetical protein
MRCGGSLTYAGGGHRHERGHRGHRGHRGGQQGAEESPDHRHLGAGVLVRLHRLGSLLFRAATSRRRPRGFDRRGRSPGTASSSSRWSRPRSWPSCRPASRSAPPPDPTAATPARPADRGLAGPAHRRRSRHHRHRRTGPGRSSPRSTPGSGPPRPCGQAGKAFTSRAPWAASRNENPPRHGRSRDGNGALRTVGIQTWRGGPAPGRPWLRSQSKAGPRRADGASAGPGTGDRAPHPPARARTCPAGRSGMRRPRGANA